MLIFKFAFVFVKTKYKICFWRLIFDVFIRNNCLKMVWNFATIKFWKSYKIFGFSVFGDNFDCSSINSEKSGEIEIADFDRSSSI